MGYNFVADITSLTLLLPKIAKSREITINLTL